MRNKIFIMGHSGSGKSTLAKELCETLELTRIKTFTSRPQREGEGEDDYHFVNSFLFKDLEEEKAFTGIRKYGTFIEGLLGTHCYGIPIKDLKNGGVCIIDIEGYEEIVDTQYVGRNSAIGFFIDLDKDTLKSRASSRPDFNEKEWERRYSADCKTMNSEYVDELNLYNPNFPHLIYKLDGELPTKVLVEQIEQVLVEHGKDRKAT